MEADIESGAALGGPNHPLGYRDYRLFWLARFCGVIATMSLVVVLGWQVYDVARSDYGMSRSTAAFQLGILGFVQFLPLLVLTPIAGFVADRYDRRQVAALSVLIDAFVAAGLGIATWMNSLSLPLLFGLAALHGVARIFFGPAMSSLAPNLVPPRLIPKAIAVNSIAWQFASILGPAAGGLLYAVFPTLPYIVSVILLLVTALLIIPAAAARRFSRSPEQMAVWAGVVAAVSVALGLALSWFGDVPAGPAVVLSAAGLFLFAGRGRQLGA